ncbi:MAG: hypothetical protein CBB95_17770 [Alteromonas sp. TMED35]|uniref:hypothetical protein n=1 Tax=uncultured Alteromonas sp. TaxID=179113 RepID=UPI000B7131A1|nr:MAG: hypothetical protein CBB95_17770 [Alteromonas sp. TMED35]|tara:strand:+ start:52973 stop:53197 length:225 start_codon:yes stop_codon:yes gene_type:complete
MNNVPLLDAKTVSCPDLHRVVWMFIRKTLGQCNQVNVVTKEPRAKSRIALICSSENFTFSHVQHGDEHHFKITY